MSYDGVVGDDIDVVAYDDDKIRFHRDAIRLHEECVVDLIVAHATLHMCRH